MLPGCRGRGDAAVPMGFRFVRVLRTQEKHDGHQQFFAIAPLMDHASQLKFLLLGLSQTVVGGD